MKPLRGYVVLDENGQGHAYAEAVGQELIARGIIFQRDGQWRILNKDLGTLETKYTYLAVCDFCGGRPVAWDVECEDFNMGGPADLLTSKGGWAACEECGALIEAGDREALLARVLPRFDPRLRPSLRVMQVRFWSHLRGIKRIPVRLFGH